MSGRVPQAWILGAFAVAALVGFHWYAYRVARLADAGPVNGARAPAGT